MYLKIEKFSMRSRWRQALFSTVAVSALMFAGPAMGQAQVGTSAAVRGEVFVTTKGRERTAAVREQIFLQDQVVTKIDSALQILLLDASIFTVGQNCSLVIDRFVYDPGSGAGDMAATVAKGAFRFMSGRIGKNDPTKASVKTPAASIGIRGTFLEGIVGVDAIILALLGGIEADCSDPDSASIVLLRGPGRDRNTLDDVGTITVTSNDTALTISEANYFAYVPCEDADPMGPFPVTEQMLEYLDLLLRSQPNGPQTNPFETGSGDAGQDQFNDPTGGNPDPNSTAGTDDGNVPSPPPPPPPPPPPNPPPPPPPPPPVIAL